MRTITTHTKVYTYPELSEAAQEKVRQDMNRLYWDDGFAQENMRGIWDSLLEEKGWKDYHGLCYDDLYSQGGDQITWRGEFNFTHTDDDGVETVFEVTVGRRHVGGGMEVFTVDLQNTENDSFHEYSDIELAEEDKVEHAVKEYLYELQQQLFRDFRAEDEYQSSDAVIADTCEANQYEFTAEGILT